MAIIRPFLTLCAQRNLRANSDLILTEKLVRKLHIYKHTVVCTRQERVVSYKTLNQLSIMGILL